MKPAHDMKPDGLSGFYRPKYGFTGPVGMLHCNYSENDQAVVIYSD